MSEVGSAPENLEKDRPSIHDSQPEIGGSEARQGFNTQDHVAAGFCISMANDIKLKEVWCESQDDITLIWESPEGERVEFVQVKGGEVHTLWSAATLCERESAVTPAQSGNKDASKPSKRSGTSVLERSLAHDRYKQASSFRLVTSRAVNQELSILTYEIGSGYRNVSTARIDALAVRVRGLVGDFRSQNGNDSEYWLKHTVWQAGQTDESLRNRNIVSLHRLLGSLGTYVPPDYVEEIYNRLVRKCFDAARQDARRDPEKRKIRRSDLLVWMNRVVEELVRPAMKGGDKLREKMRKARLSEDSIIAALEERNRYREEILTPRYFTRSEHTMIEGEVVATLHTLRTQLDAGFYQDSGLEFHLRCRSGLEALRQTVSVEKQPSLAFLHGCMYDIADRCAHRFLRAAS